MQNHEPVILLLEDDQSQSGYYELLLKNIGFRVHPFAVYEDALEALDAQKYDAFVLDLQIDIRDMDNKGAGGDTFMKIALKKHPDAPVAIISGYFDQTWGSRLSRIFMETTSCLYAHIEKPGEVQLTDWAKKVFDFWKLKNPSTHESKYYHSEDYRVKNIIDDLIPIVASSKLPVFIIGKTGTGKEDIARIIHNHPENPYRTGRFVAVNCAAVNNELLLSDLFGHVRGAYTGAEQHRLGWFLEASGWNRNAKQKQNTESYLQWYSSGGGQIQYASKANFSTQDAEEVYLMNNIYKVTDEQDAEFVYVNSQPGTLFLDEIGDLTPSAEAALLRALDGYGIRPLGYTGPALLPNCCIIAATNQIENTSDLHNAATSPGKKGIRKELYHRLAGWVLELPPLRDRSTKDGTPEWIISLLKWAARDNMHFQNGDLEQYAQSLTEDKKGILWDGNWRELRYFYARAKAIAQRHNGDNVIKKKDLEFAGKWVLLENDQITTSSPDEEINKDVLYRLDCILALHHALKETQARGISLGEVNFSNIGLCPEAMKAVSNKTLLTDSIKTAQEAGKITNACIDILIERKGNTKGWWKNNLDQVAMLINSQEKYKPLLPIVVKLTPTNFNINNGNLEARTIA